MAGQSDTILEECFTLFCRFSETRSTNEASDSDNDSIKFSIAAFAVILCFILHFIEQLHQSQTNPVSKILSLNYEKFKISCKLRTHIGSLKTFNSLFYKKKIHDFHTNRMYELLTKPVHGHDTCLSGYFSKSFTYLIKSCRLQKRGNLAGLY